MATELTARISVKPETLQRLNVAKALRGMQQDELLNHMLDLLEDVDPPPKRPRKKATKA